MAGTGSTGESAESAASRAGWIRLDVAFVDEDVRSAYRERVQNIIDAIELKMPARVPLVPQMGLYVAKYGGLTVRESMYDHEKLARAWDRYHTDFLPDVQADPLLPGLPLELLGARFVSWPGHGVEDDDPWQYVEAEYMAADEYDDLMADPSAYFMRSLLPRLADAFAPLAALQPFTDTLEAVALPFTILPFGEPDVVEGLRRLAAAAAATSEYLETVNTMCGDVTARLGLPTFSSAMVKAPYDVLADTLRGTRGIVRDRFRQPDKILAAAERFVPLQIDAARRQSVSSDSPLVFIPLHKGADGFMSDADFRTFYWPTLKAVLRGLVAEGLVPMLFAEGGYNERLPVIADADLPPGSVIWWFDATDMEAARSELAGYACICGNVPGALLAVGTASQVEEYVSELLDAVAPEGGFILGTGAVIDDARPETLRAMLETGRAWRG